MPIYEYRCEICGGQKELVRPVNAQVECCGAAMRRLPPLPAFFRIKGQGYPARKKWMDNWTPDSPEFPTVSVHGEKH